VLCSGQTVTPRTGAGQHCHPNRNRAIGAQQFPHSRDRDCEQREGEDQKQIFRRRGESEPFVPFFIARSRPKPRQRIDYSVAGTVLAQRLWLKRFSRHSEMDQTNDEDCGCHGAGVQESCHTGPLHDASFPLAATGSESRQKRQIEPSTANGRQTRWRNDSDCLEVTFWAGEYYHNRSSVQLDSVQSGSKTSQR
jgi:hypothetical protein